MGFQVSETSPLPLQLQLEAHVAGTQKLAYVPTSGPSMDFYYLNYRPSYKAGESTIDFWMITPKGTQPPKTASLELYDEFGKIRLATVVQPGTDVPTSKASQGLPFLWKSWRVPLSLDASFDFSEKFRVVLKISDSNHHKRAMEEVNRDIFFAVKSKNKHLTSANNARTVDSPFSPFNSDGIPGSVIIQDRQFRIKGLKATPGGQPNPTKISSVAQPSIPKASAESSAPTTNSETEEVTVDHTMGKLSSALSIGTSLSVTFILAVLVMGSISTVV
ncbi:hypothetical protein BG004_004461 [Podila humilis]|nr:hypothetical protein BG004_004461 [Podila humilis]